MCPKLVADEFAAECGEHVGVADCGLLAVPRGRFAAGGEVSFGVAVDGVPRDRDRLGEEPERTVRCTAFWTRLRASPTPCALASWLGGLDRPAAVERAISGDALALVSVLASATPNPSLRPGLRIRMNLTVLVWNGVYHRHASSWMCSVRWRPSGAVIVPGVKFAVLAICARVGSFAPLSGGRPVKALLTGAPPDGRELIDARGRWRASVSSP